MKYKVTKKSEMPLNSMKPVSVNGDEKLLVRTKNDQFYALDVDCPHEGAPLYTGLLFDDKIMCPWHHACFNCRNGKAVEPPALNDLSTYKVSIENDDIYIELNDKAKETVKDTDSEDSYDKRIFMIIGSGAAGRAAADKLRTENFRGKIILISEDQYPSYDRTALSKDFLSRKLDEKDILLQTKTYFDENNIELQLNRKVASLDTLTNTVTLDDGSNIVYDKLLIASGSKPIIPNIPGTELRNILSLRNMKDAKSILKMADESKKCVIIGSSFIALEAASQLKEKELELVIVTKDKVPFEKILGEKIGRFLMEKHEELGVKFLTETEPLSFKGNGSVKEIELSDGDRLKTDFVLIGIGVSPSTEFIESKTMDDNSLNVDEYLNFTKDVYAAGDLATFPDSVSGNQIRIEHWRTAQQQGQTAALNMLGKNKIFKAIPFFQTSQLGLNIQYIGHAKQWEDIIIDGEIEKNNFLAFYFVDKEIKAVAGAGKDEEIMLLEKLFQLNKISEIKEHPVNFKHLKDLIDESN